MRSASASLKVLRLFTTIVAGPLNVGATLLKRFWLDTAVHGTSRGPKMTVLSRAMQVMKAQ